MMIKVVDVAGVTAILTNGIVVSTIVYSLEDPEKTSIELMSTTVA